MKIIWMLKVRRRYMHEGMSFFNEIILVYVTIFIEYLTLTVTTLILDRKPENRMPRSW